jgi:6-phosphofructokinase 1
VSLHSPNVECIPLADAIGKRKTVSLYHDIILTARELGIYFGDELSSIQE